MEENKLVLPAIAVRGIVPLPNNEFRIEVGRENSVLALDAAEKMYGGNVLLLIQKDANKVEVEPTDIEPIGVLAKITLKLKLPNKNYKVKFKIADRISVLEYTSLDPYFVCAYEKLHSVLNGDDLETALIKKVSNAIQLLETHALILLSLFILNIVFPFHSSQILKYFLHLRVFSYPPRGTDGDKKKPGMFFTCNFSPFSFLFLSLQLSLFKPL